MSNVTRPKQFETSEQIGRTLADLDAALADAAQATSRLERLRGKLAGEIAEIQQAADDLDFMSEKEFADAIGIKETLLADLRRRYELPHSVFGREPRYTREHRRRIAEILEVNSRKGTSRINKAA